MGYSGLTRVDDSDRASDLLGEVADNIGKILQNNVNEVENEFNTDGCVNVALIFEGLILKSCIKNYQSDILRKVAKTALEKLEIKIKETKKEPVSEDFTQRDKDYHIESYQRMARHLRKWINE